MHQFVGRFPMYIEGTFCDFVLDIIIIFHRHILELASFMPIRSVNNKLIHLHETVEQIKGATNQSCQARERERANTRIILYDFCSNVFQWILVEAKCHGYSF